MMEEDITTGTNDVSLTLKGGTGFDAPWLVLKGTPAEIRTTAIELCGIKAEDAEGKNVAEVAALAASLFALACAGQNVSSGLGATRATGGRSVGNRPAVTGGTKKADEPADPNAPLLAAIAEAGTVAALKEVFVRNKGTFEAEQKAGKEQPLREAFVARGALLRGAEEKAVAA